jgi:hypothetical protein
MPSEQPMGRRFMMSMELNSNKVHFQVDAGKHS